MNKTKQLNNIKIPTELVKNNIKRNLEMCELALKLINIEIYRLNKTQLPSWTKFDRLKKTVKWYEENSNFRILNNTHFDECGNIEPYKITAKQKAYFFKREKNRLFSIEVRKINGPYVDPDVLND